MTEFFFGSSHDDRYTNAGDTVVSLSAERHNLVEGALERSRRVEVFVANPESKKGARENLNASFSRAYKAGKWKVRRIYQLLSSAEYIPSAHVFLVSHLMKKLPLALGAGRNANGNMLFCLVVIAKSGTCISLLLLFPSLFARRYLRRSSRFLWSSIA